jgi:hypothetical protein
MKAIAALTIMMALPACEPGGEAPASGPAAPQAVPAPCPLEIEFGSYAMGIDSATLARVEQLLAAERVAVARTPWGREGEVTLCAAARSAADAERMARRIAALLPPEPRGPIAVRTASGLAFRAGR